MGGTEPLVVNPGWFFWNPASLWSRLLVPCMYMTPVFGGTLVVNPGKPKVTLGKGVFGPLVPACRPEPEAQARLARLASGRSAKRRGRGPENAVCLLEVRPSALLPFLFWGSQNRLEKKVGTLILTSLLEDLVVLCVFLCFSG